MDPKDMKVISPKKHLVKEVWARSRFSIERDSGEDIQDRMFLVGYFEENFEIDKLKAFLKQKGLYFSLGSSEVEPKFFVYNKYIESGIVFETFEECENFIRSGVSMESLSDLARYASLQEIKI